MLKLDRGLAADLVNFLLSLAVSIRVLHEMVQCEGEHSGSGFMPSNKERNQVIEDALFGHFLARLGINAIKHGGEQIPARI